MKIDGRLIATEIKEQLKTQIIRLKSQHITPHLAVILVGSDPSSAAYVSQKQKVGNDLGVKVSVLNSPLLAKKDLLKLANRLNEDKNIHGIIIQRPLPINIGKDILDRLVIPQKDIDGFHPKSPYIPPISLAVLEILKWVFATTHQWVTRRRDPKRSLHRPSDLESNNNFNLYRAGLEASFGTPERQDPHFANWLRSQKILIIGRGETGGKPIADTFKDKNIPFKVAHSKTTNLKELTLKSEIIISCVGGGNILRSSEGHRNNVFPIVRRNMVMDKTILIGVGLHPEGNKLAADYDQGEIEEKVAFYTPVPGGVGPVNVACLFVNLLQAIKRQAD